MATQYIKFAKKCLKNFFSQIIGGAMAPFGQGVATPMISRSKNEKICKKLKKTTDRGTYSTTSPWRI